MPFPILRPPPRRARRSLLAGLLLAPIVLLGAGCGSDPPRPAGSGQVSLVPAFGGEAFFQPMELLPHPLDDDRWYVVEKEGYVETFLASDPSGTRAIALDLRGSRPIHTDGERGLLGMAFDPDFGRSGLAYLSYVAATSGAGVSVIARYQTSDGGLLFTPHADEVVLELPQPASNHNGGDLAFGPDGMLYASFGDGGGGGDRFRNGQNLGTIFGSVIRIDVDTHPYAIPADNPFANDPNVGAKEIFAYGLRNPWRMSFDTVTGDLWLGDVGQSAFEEIDRVVAGGNHGWPLKEGFACFDARPPCDAIAGLVDPIAAHGRSEAVAISGGFVYRGSEIEELVGAYVYGDHGTGNLWALFDPTGPAARSQLLVASPHHIAGFGQGRDGEIYLLDNSLQASTQGGTGAPIQRLVRPVVPMRDDAPAELLSETGFVDPKDPLAFAADVIPYDVNAPLWSDGALKQRGLALPSDTQIGIGPDGDLELPVGTVLLKHFLIDDAPVETRLLMHPEPDVWAGYSYEWNESGSDARRLSDGKQIDVGGLPWLFPSPSQCPLCHTTAAGVSLGLELPQLDRSFDYGAGRIDGLVGLQNQIDALDGIGLFATAPPAPVNAFPELFSTAPIEDRARAALHANCAMCHRPGGPGGGALDLRYETPLADAGMCDVAPLQGDLGLPNARILAPGTPASSVLLARMRDAGVSRMPPLASFLVDEDAAAVVEAWISGLTDCL